ncbi:Tim44 domain-containing protein [Stappia sp. F7233]|uniref:Large ribosomal subunit protein mL45 n=1 Tax=Stappia albiluteola TaxID=2758565 RepID=A0A839AI50_9HYPH|nr:Tim44/TimA family putative adaptor protein [Stappia albiluteola]MBA5778805.1 Tim44 domain-containing protein [Stappia albiluteola]
MSDIFDVYNIIFLVLAVVIFLRLRSVLGKRTGNERPPYDPYSAPKSSNGTGDGARNGGDNVIPLPGQGEPQDLEPETSSPTATLDKMAPKGSALNEALRQILSVDREFEPGHFLQGAKAAYEMIVTAFAQGDRKSLRNLLSKEVHDGFVSAISDRESRQESVDFTFVGIEKAEIVEAALKGSVAQVTVRFQSELISATRNKDGNVVEGDPGKVSDVTDIWTFARDTTSRDPNWKLVATESVE